MSYPNTPAERAEHSKRAAIEWAGPIHPLDRWIMANGTTRKQFAFKIGCSATHLNNIIHRSAVPSLVLKRRIFSATGGAILT